MAHTVDISVTFYVDGSQVPATVTRLCKRYFEVSVPARGRVAAEVRRYTYGGDRYGAPRVSKAHERRYGISATPGIGHEDLKAVRRARAEVVR